MLLKLVEGGSVKFVVNKQHRYCVGFKHPKGYFYPVTSCETREELERGYIGWLYFSAEEPELSEPFPVERNGPQGTILQSIIEKHNSFTKYLSSLPSSSAS